MTFGYIIYGLWRWVHIVFNLNGRGPFPPPPLHSTCNFIVGGALTRLLQFKNEYLVGFNPICTQLVYYLTNSMQLGLATCVMQPDCHKQ